MSYCLIDLSFDVLVCQEEGAYLYGTRLTGIVTETETCTRIETSYSYNLLFVLESMFFGMGLLCALLGPIDVAIGIFGGLMCVHLLGCNDYARTSSRTERYLLELLDATRANIN